jgi:hypothetical protein
MFRLLLALYGGCVQILRNFARPRIDQKCGMPGVESKSQPLDRLSRVLVWERSDQKRRPLVVLLSVWTERFALISCVLLRLWIDQKYQALLALLGLVAWIPIVFVRLFWGWRCRSWTPLQTLSMTLKAPILLGDVGPLTSQRPRRLHYTKLPAAGDEADSEGSKDQKHVSGIPCENNSERLPNEASHCPICKLPHARLH